MTDPDSGTVLASYLAVLAIPAVLWALANPLAGGGTIAATAAAYWGGRRLRAVTKRLARRRAVSIQVGERLQITARRAGPGEHGPSERCCA